MKLTPLCMAAVALLVHANAALSAEVPTPASPDSRSAQTKTADRVNINSSHGPMDEDLCWEAPEWREEPPTQRVTQVRDD